MEARSICLPSASPRHATNRFPRRSRSRTVAGPGKIASHRPWRLAAFCFRCMLRVKLSRRQPPLATVAIRICSRTTASCGVVAFTLIHSHPTSCAHSVTALRPSTSSPLLLAGSSYKLHPDHDRKMRVTLRATALVIGVLAAFVSAHPRISLQNPKVGSVEGDGIQLETRQGDYGGPASF